MKNQHSPWLLAADIWRILSKSFAYPDEKNCAQINELCKIIVTRDLSSLPAGLLLNRLAEGIQSSAVIEDYSRLFIRGNIPLNESFCTGNLDAVADVSAFYKAFGLKSRSGDSPDSLPYQLEFLSVLCVKFALADNEEQKEICESAYARFLMDHLRGFKNKLKERFNVIEAGEFYPLVVDILDQFTESQINELQPLTVN